ncbi:MAG TPA: VWA domain-containing protein [Candidatus Binatia bacterium]|nr:VWA domain-containing protein [Candidatus Binatia bacterium]
MIFLQPEYFKLFFLLAFLAPLWLFYFFSKVKARKRLGAAGLVRKISHLHSLWRDGIRYLLINLALVALVLALAHPQLIREKQVSQPEKMDVVFLLDNSPSMRAEDVPPSRLERALEIVGRFARNKPSQDRIGLVSFASGSLILSYLTEDPSNVLYYLNYLKDDSSFNPGTNIGRAIQNGLTVLARDAELYPQIHRKKRIFILISDGEDHGDELESAVRAAVQQGIRIHTIGIGSLEGAPIPIGRENGLVRYVEDAQGNTILSRFDERSLQWIAETTGGSVQRSFTGQELEGFFAGIVRQERKIEGFKKVVEYEDTFRGFLFGAFGLLLLGMLV